jgi:CheY-like chemotaxis protein
MGRIVLIIDDDVDDRDFFCEALSEIDTSIKCVCATNGYEALNILSQPDVTTPDYIFLDLNMPRLGGIQCLTSIKKIKKLSQVPVIIFSTTRQNEEAEETKQLGAVMFLTKPSRYTELIQMLSAILSQSFSTNKVKKSGKQ